MTLAPLGSVADAIRRTGAIGQRARNLLLLLLVVLPLLLSLSACSKEPGEPRREPGTFLRPGGDVITGDRP